MKNLLVLPLLFIAFLSFSQQFKYAAPVPHYDGTPTGTPTSYNSWLRFDKTNAILYKWNGTIWSSKFTAQATGSAAVVGTATLSGGEVTVTTTAITANSKVFITPVTIAGSAPAVHFGYTAVVTGTSFTIISYDDVGDHQTGDNSTVNWFIVN
jgi:hypothetical protein